MNRREPEPPFPSTIGYFYALANAGRSGRFVSTETAVRAKYHLHRDKLIVRIAVCMNTSFAECDQAAKHLENWQLEKVYRAASEGSCSIVNGRFCWPWQQRA